MFDTMTMLLVFAVLVIAAGMWQARKMKTMVFCTYTSRSKQEFDKVVREKDRCVIFEGKKFYILPEFGKSRHYTKGLSSLFPTKITSYSFRWNSSLPIDPNTGEPAMVSPEVINKLNQEGALLSYAGSNQQALATARPRMVGLDRWMPMIMIGMVIAVAYLIWMNMQMQSNDKITQQAIIDIYNTFNSMGQPIVPAP